MNIALLKCDLFLEHCETQKQLLPYLRQKGPITPEQHQEIEAIYKAEGERMRRVEAAHRSEEDL